MAHDNTAASEAASSTLTQRIKAILDRHNKLMAEGYPLIDPSASIELAYHFGIADVIQTMADCDIPLPQGISAAQRRLKLLVRLCAGLQVVNTILGPN